MPRARIVEIRRDAAAPLGAHWHGVAWGGGGGGMDGQQRCCVDDDDDSIGVETWAVGGHTR